MGFLRAAILVIPLGLDLHMPVPEDNPLTAEKIALGQRLFNDRRLSRDQSLACSSCHNPRRAFSDSRAVAIGVFARRGHRHAPALINRGYGGAFFWDGRVRTLEEQVLKPIEDPNEMDLTLADAVARLRRDRRYVAQFRSVFDEDVSPKNLAMALASYVRSILAGAAPFDRYSNGDRGALSARARHGLQLFRAKANCTACHVGPTFSDERFHNTGIAWGDGRLLDEGRFLVTSKPEDRGAFKTPTLREIARTAPYMHDGSLATLQDVIDFYDAGGRPNPHLDLEIHPLHLTAEEKQALVIFLESLSGTIRDDVR
jgi:cytochrome c peroxidase